MVPLCGWAAWLAGWDLVTRIPPPRSMQLPKSRWIASTSTGPTVLRNIRQGRGRAILNDLAQGGRLDRDFILGVLAVGVSPIGVKNLGRLIDRHR